MPKHHLQRLQMIINACLKNEDKAAAEREGCKDMVSEEVQCDEVYGWQCVNLFIWNTRYYLYGIFKLMFI